MELERDNTQKRKKIYEVDIKNSAEDMFICRVSNHQL